MATSTSIYIMSQIMPIHMANAPQYQAQNEQRDAKEGSGDSMKGVGDTNLFQKKPKLQLLFDPVEKNRTRLDLNCAALPAENSSKSNTSGYLHLLYESFPTDIFQRLISSRHSWQYIQFSGLWCHRANVPALAAGKSFRCPHCACHSILCAWMTSEFTFPRCLDMYHLFQGK